MTFTANLGDRPTDIAANRRSGQGQEAPGDQNETQLGITVEELTPAILQELGMNRETGGVVVTHVSRVTEAWEKGVNSGDIVTEVNRVPVAGLSDYRKEIRKVKAGGLVILYVVNPPSRTGGDPISRYVTLRVPKEQ
jgi:serine protease Do